MVGIRRSETRQAHEWVAPAMRPWERTGSVDVETLAAWAYGVQMVDRFERAGLHAIEAAAAGLEVNGYSGCGVGQLMKIQHLGCRIDQARAYGRDDVHPAAYAVAGAVRGLEHGQHVRTHALAGTRPTGWLAPERKARATVWVKPWIEAQVEYQGPGRKGGYCQVILSWDARREASGRAAYRLWWQALSDLAWQLSLASLGFAVTGPAAAPEPWQAAPGGPPAIVGGPALLPPAGGGRAASPPPFGSSQQAGG